MTIENNELTLQDWITRFEYMGVSDTEKRIIELKHQDMPEEFYLLFEIVRSYDARKNIVKMFYCTTAGSNIYEYKPTFYELSIKNWKLVDEDWVDLDINSSCNGITNRINYLI